MAMRRQPFSQRLGDLADIFLKQHLTQQNQDYENNLVTKRQSALSQQQAQQTVLDQILKNPDMLAKFVKANPTQQIGGVNPATFAQTPDEAINAVGKGIAGTSELGKLPTEQDVTTLLQGQPGYQDQGRTPIEQLMAAVAARRDAIISGVKPELKDVELPGANGTSVKGVRAMNPFNPDLSQGVATGATPQQLGTNKGVEEAAQLSAPGLVQNRITAHNLFEQGTQAADVSKAGATARVTTPPHIEQQFDDAGNPKPPVRINPWGGAATPIEGAGPTSAIAGLQSERNKGDQIGRLHDTLDRTDKLLEQAKQYDLTGPLGGRVADFMAGKVGSTGDVNADRLFGQLKLDMQSIPAQIALGIGEGARGAGSVRMLENWKPLFSLNGPDVMRGAIAETRLLIPKKAAPAGPAGSRPTTPPGAQPRNKRYNPSTGQLE